MDGHEEVGGETGTEGSCGLRLGLGTFLAHIFCVLLTSFPRAPQLSLPYTLFFFFGHILGDSCTYCLTSMTFNLDMLMNTFSPNFHMGSIIFDDDLLRKFE